MVFSSISFLCFFLPALLFCYYMIPSAGRKARNFVLLLFSLFFYAFSGIRFLLLILVSITVNYLCGLLAGSSISKRARKYIVALACAVNLGLLGWFKYAMFVAQNLSAFGCHIPIPEITLPIGISFFTFQGLSYVIDVYRGNAPVQKNPLYVALYIILFPQLVAGPIVRYATVAHEITFRHETISDFSAGATRFLFGFAKKMILANALGEIADAAFSTPASHLALSLAWVGALAYTGQIYFDFSAYSDMAIGLGRMFGFHFLENFNYPYISQSITEFWRRWHISLSTWFRDYVYIPLGGNRRGNLIQLRNLAIVWLLTGIWHGAAWTYIAWGIWFGILLIGEKFIWGSVWNHLPRLFRHLLTMLLVVISWVIFRSDSIGYAAQFLSCMFTNQVGLYDRQTVYLLQQYLPEWVGAVLAVFPLKHWLTHFLQNKNASWADFILAWAPPVLALFLFVFSYMKLVTGSFNPFIYFQF